MLSRLSTFEASVILQTAGTCELAPLEGTRRRTCYRSARPAGEQPWITKQAVH